MGVQGLISRLIILRVYKIDITKIGNNAWRRRFWQLLLVIPTSFVFPYVSLLSINNVIIFALRIFHVHYDE